MALGDWREQWERTNRWLKRVQFPPTATDNPDAHLELFMDDLWAFFQNCWHIKDWVKNDESLPHEFRHRILDPDAGLEKELERSEVLQIVGDLCNRTKHLGLHRERVGATFGLVRTRHRIEVTNDGEQQTVAHDVEVGFFGRDDSLDAMKLAKAAMGDWVLVLAKFNLRPS